MTYFLDDDVGVTATSAGSVHQFLDLFVKLVDDSLLLRQAVVEVTHLLKGQRSTSHSHTSNV